MFVTNPSSMGSLINLFIIYGIAFILGSFGGMLSECSGIINIALEGSMVIGAFAGIIFMYGIGTAAPNSYLMTDPFGVQILFLLAALIAITAGLLFSFLLSFVSIKLKANQTIVGTALNTLAVCICVIINSSIMSKDTPEMNLLKFNLQKCLIPTTGNNFVDSAFAGFNLSMLLGVIAIVIIVLMMTRTRFGLRLRACGENPAAADSVGINVNRMRYIGTALGCAAAGLGGFVVFSWFATFNGNWTISALGYGFLVLAVEILGNWKPKNIIFAALFFAFFTGFAPVFTAYLSISGTFSRNSILSKEAFYYMIPYLLAFLTLIFFSKKSHAPKAEGIPYDKSTR